ncbi:hypothetical protein L21SP2_2551 [Salinispira pacifica]|uniref:Uncharacterized protein n=1 Tax=Salinispira pacifica TaxID=1307761 RepID=V5WJF0_9SPIO|nr:hypothetical protein L21SP2_2551 [Salinispira pacifica]
MLKSIIDVSSSGAGFPVLQMYHVSDRRFPGSYSSMTGAGTAK